MAEEIRKTEIVENLIGFPYESYSEFKKKWNSGNIQMGVDFGLAREWAMSGGLYVPETLTVLLNLVNLSMFSSLIGFVIYVFVIKSYLYLLALPLLVIGFFLAHPVFSRNSGCLSPGYFLLTGAGFFWAVCSGNYGVLGITACIFFIWLCAKIIYSTSLQALLNAAATHEDLLCRLWDSGQIRIISENGDVFMIPLQGRL